MTQVQPLAPGTKWRTLAGTRQVESAVVRQQGLLCRTHLRASINVATLINEQPMSAVVSESAICVQHRASRELVRQRLPRPLLSPGVARRRNSPNALQVEVPEPVLHDRPIAHFPARGAEALISRNCSAKGAFSELSRRVASSAHECG